MMTSCKDIYKKSDLKDYQYHNIGGVCTSVCHDLSKQNNCEIFICYYIYDGANSQKRDRNRRDTIAPPQRRVNLRRAAAYIVTNMGRKKLILSQ